MADFTYNNTKQAEGEFGLQLLSRNLRLYAVNVAVGSGGSGGAPASYTPLPADATLADIPAGARIGATPFTVPFMAKTLIGGLFDFADTQFDADAGPYYAVDAVVVVEESPLQFAAGFIMAIAKALIVEGATFTLNDGVNAPTVFEFDNDASVVGANVAVDISAATTAADVAAAMASTINGVGAGLAITAGTTFGPMVPLTNDATGFLGNQVILDTVEDGSFVCVGMTGGGTGVEDDGKLRWYYDTTSPVTLPYTPVGSVKPIHINPAGFIQLA